MPKKGANFVGPTKPQDVPSSLSPLQVASLRLPSLTNRPVSPSLWQPGASGLRDGLDSDPQALLLALQFTPSVASSPEVTHTARVAVPAAAVTVLPLVGIGLRANRSPPSCLGPSVPPTGFSALIPGFRSKSLGHVP